MLASRGVPAVQLVPRDGSLQPHPGRTFVLRRGSLQKQVSEQVKWGLGPSSATRQDVTAPAGSRGEALGLLLRLVPAFEELADLRKETLVLRTAASLPPYLALKFLEQFALPAR